MQDLTPKRAWGSRVNGCRISIAADKDEIQPGKPINLSMVLRNDGTAVVNSPRVSDWFDFEYAILGPVGMPPPMTQFGAKLLKNRQETGGGTLLDINPGEEFPLTVEVSQLYEFTEIGSYSIAVSKMLYTAAADYFRVGSNQITVSVKK
jgi:hypothetical protein